MSRFQRGLYLLLERVENMDRIGQSGHVDEAVGVSVVPCLAVVRTHAAGRSLLPGDASIRLSTAAVERLRLKVNALACPWMRIWAV